MPNVSEAFKTNVGSPIPSPELSTEQQELVLWINNDSTLYRTMMVPIQNNLKKKILKGTYDQKKAIISFKHLADAGAQSYTKANDARTATSYGVFTPNDRQMAAKDLQNSFEQDVLDGNFDTE